MSEFEASVITAVTGHMNGDHPEDNLLIARAFGRPEATGSTMVGLDGAAGIWRVTDPSGEHELRVDWPGGPIGERAEIRREVVVLYTSACEKLGVAPREEHGAAPQGDAHAQHGHGGGHGQAAHGHGGGQPDDEGSFAQELREATWADHGDSEQSTFMDDILKGRGTVDDYAALVAQHFFMYRALEAASAQLAADPRYAVFHPEALVRLPAIEADLDFLMGAGWRERVEALPSTAAYVARIEEVAAAGWLPGIVAHHYTRYLGDLSGGQMIARALAKQHGFDRAGVAFYDFAELGPIPHFKRAYREALDALRDGLSEEERQRVIDEVRAAYRFNTLSFVDLDRARGVAPAPAAA